jgi:RNase P protein component
MHDKRKTYKQAHTRNSLKRAMRSKSQSPEPLIIAAAQNASASAVDDADKILSEFSDPSEC